MARSYLEKLKDPRWQKLRLEVLQDRNWTCEKCGSTEKSFHVHHPKYVRGREPWEYPMKELQVLCEDCHISRHALQERMKEYCAAMDQQMLEEVLGFMAGLCRINQIDVPGAKYTCPFSSVVQGFVLSLLSINHETIMEIEAATGAKPSNLNVGDDRLEIPREIVKKAINLDL